jgi:PhnB protein
VDADAAASGRLHVPKPVKNLQDGRWWPSYLRLMTPDATEGRLSHQAPGSSTLTPYICVAPAADAITWYVEILGATEEGDRFVGPDGKVGHAELRIGDAVLMLSDPHHDYGCRAPDPADPLVTYSLHVYVPDTDAVVAVAVERGATLQRGVRDEFYGARTGTIVDPFGVRWMVATHQRTPAEGEFREAVDEYRRKGAPPVEDASA